MLQSQRHSLRLSEIRERINVLNAVESLNDEQTVELRNLTTEYPTVETRYRAALVSEDDHESGSTTANVDGETRATSVLLREARVANFMTAAAEGRPVRDTEADLLAALSIENETGAFPLQLLDSRLEGRPGVETRQDVATDLGADDEQTTLTTRPWIDRVFIPDSSAEFLGVTRETVGSGDRRYVVVTGGTTAATTARGGKQNAAAFTIDTEEVEPRRMSAGYLFRREDVARHGGQLESSMRRDLRMVLTEHVDRACLQGETGQYAGLTDVGADRLITTETDLKVGGTTTDPDRAAFLAALSAQLDGRYAVMPSHVRALVSRTVYNRVLTNLAAATADSMTVLEVARRIGFMLQVSDHLATATTANTIVGVVSRARGLMGTIVMPVWDAASLIVDPYTRAAEGEVRLTLTMLFGQPTAVRAANWALFKATA